MHDSGPLLPWKQLPAEAACSPRLTKEVTSPGDQSQPGALPGQKGFSHVGNPCGNRAPREIGPGKLAGYEDSGIKMAASKG